MGQAESFIPRTAHNIAETKQDESLGVSPTAHDSQGHSVGQYSKVPLTKSQPKIQGNARHDITGETDFIKEFVHGLVITKKLLSLQLMLQHSPEQLKNELLLLHSSPKNDIKLPQLKGDYFQVGEPSQECEDFTFYVRIGPWKDVEEVSNLRPFASFNVFLKLLFIPFSPTHVKLYL